MMQRRSLVLGLSASAFMSFPASASETITYSYDALGRLVASSTNGGPNSGVTTGVSYDPAGNRSSYTVTGSISSLNLRGRPQVLLAERRQELSVGIKD